MGLLNHEVILGVYTCPLFAQMVLLLHMLGNVNLLAKLVHLLLTEPGRLS